MTIVRLCGALALVGCGVQFGSEEPSFVDACPNLDVETVPFDNDSRAVAAAALFGERTGTATWEGGGETDLDVTLTTMATEVRRATLSREPSAADRIDGCVDHTAFSAILRVVTTDGAIDGAFPVRAVVTDDGAVVVDLQGSLAPVDHGGTWQPDLETREELVSIEVGATWTAEGTTGAVEGRVEGEDDQAAWDRSLPGLTFAIDTTLSEP